MIVTSVFQEKMLISSRLVRLYSREPALVVIAEAVLSPEPCTTEGSVTTAARGLVHDSAGCATLAAAAATKNSGVRCHGGFENSPHS